jgi:acyl-CoA synthetase (NDP forming)
MKLQHTDLEKFFRPKHIAIVGVSSGAYKFGGHSFLLKLQESGFQGRLSPINPKAAEIEGLKAYPNLSSLPDVPDPAILEECARLGLNHIHILSSGFKETGREEGRALEEKIAAIAENKGLKIIGPNCMGPYCPATRLTPWGAMPGRSGSLGIISQSGGLTQRLTEYTCSLGVGVEKAVSFGNAAVLDSTDFLEAMAEDPNIEVIAMYLESVKNARRLLEIAREVGRNKPLILWKGGESDAGAATAASHTGAMAGDQKLWQAFYRQSGVIHVRSMNECVDAVLAFSLLPAPAGTGVFIIGGGGGKSVACSDIFSRQGFDIPALSESSMEFLLESVPVAGSIAGNPLDMWRTFIDADYLAQVLAQGYRDPAVSIIVVDRLIARKAYHFPDLADPTQETIAFFKSQPRAKPTLFTIDSGGGDPALAETGARLRAQFCSAGIPAFPSAERAARALYHLSQFHKRKQKGNP